MPADLARLDQLIGESEQRITEQVFRIMDAEVAGRDTERLRRSLKALEGILVEFHHARKLAVAAQRMLARDASPPR